MNDALESLQITNGLQIRFEFIGMNATYVRRFLSVACTWSHQRRGTFST